MHKIFSVLIVLFVLGFNSYSQSQYTESETLDYQKGFSVETFHHSGFGIAMGGVISKNIGLKSKPNYGIGVYGDLLFLSGPAIGPRVKLTYNYLGVFGLNLNFSNYYRNGVNDFRITPELNFSLYGTMNVFAGYSINVSEESLTNFNEFRFGLNLVIVNKSKF